VVFIQYMIGDKRMIRVIIFNISNMFIKPGL